MITFSLRRRHGLKRADQRLPGRGFQRIVVAVADDRGTADAVDAACRLARERGARVTAVAVVEVPVELPLDCEMDPEDSRARELLESARTTADSYGISVSLRLLRAREAATAIVEEIERERADLAIVGACRRPWRKRTVLGRTVETVLRQAPCRVMLVATAAEGDGAEVRDARRRGSAGRA